MFSAIISRRSWEIGGRGRRTRKGGINRYDQLTLKYRKKYAEKHMILFGAYMGIL